jgi:hypothetical protein
MPDPTDLPMQASRIGLRAAVFAKFVQADGLFQ